MRAILLALCSLAVLAGPARAGEGEDEPARRTTERPPDVVVFVATGLRADTVGARGADGGSLTPALDALAARAVVFEAARTSHPDGTAALAGLWSARAPCGPDEVVAAPSLPERFARAGYLTVAFCDGGEVVPGTGLERGFDHFDSKFAGPAHRVDEALDFVATRPPDRPYLLVVQTYGARMPYRPAEETLTPLADAGYDGPFRRAWIQAVKVVPHEKIRNPMGLVQRGYREAFQAGEPAAADRAFVEALYAASVRETDRAFGRLVDYLERRGELTHTLVVLTSDHGTAFWERGAFGHAELSEATLGVPLVVHVPGVLPARRADAAQLVDVLPTLAAACGLAPDGDDEGRDLLAPDGRPPEATFAELDGRVLVRFGRFEALVDGALADGDATSGPTGAPRVVLHDLAADPLGALDVASEPERAADVERARALVRGWRERCMR